MKSLRFCVALSLLAAACSTPERRIRQHQAAYDASTPEVQEEIRKGKVDVGFTQEQVVMAIGKPDRVYTRATPNGSQEVWSYDGDVAAGPRVGFGFGTMFGGHGGFTHTGVAVGSGGGPYYYEDRARVVFEGGKVVSVERREK